MGTPDLSKPVQTTDGRPVRILATDVKAKQPIAGIVSNTDGSDESVESWDLTGRYFEGPSNWDLVNVPQQRTVWLNIYPSGSYSHGKSHQSRADADSKKGLDRIACIKVTYTEGQFDE